MKHGVSRSGNSRPYLMTKNLIQHARLVSRPLAVASFTLLAACIDSAAPILTDSQPLLGERPRLQLYALRDGAAHEPETETFHWRSARYVRTGGTTNDIGDFTLHAFAGGDLIVQSVRPGHPVEYAIARKLADGAYLLVAIDENDAAEATRSKFCSKEADTACRVTTREALLVMARATAAKPHTTGGLAILIAEH
jgi:hypothetical protein